LQRFADFVGNSGLIENLDCVGGEKQHFEKRMCGKIIEKGAAILHHVEQQTHGFP
jgi:hypothetical protein